MVSFRTIYQRVVDHWRAIVLLLILLCVAFIVAYSDEFDPVALILLALLLILVASQIFWIGRLIYVEGRFIPVMGVPYIRGLYEKGGAQLYMNRAALA